MLADVLDPVQRSREVLQLIVIDKVFMVSPQSQKKTPIRGALVSISIDVRNLLI